MPLSAQFLLDAQLPPALARRMSSAGYPTVHVVEQRGLAVSDPDVVAYANANAAILTKDADFADLLDRGVMKTALVWLRCGNVTPARLWSIVEPELPSVVARIAAGQRLIELA